MSDLSNFTFDDLQIGQTATFTRTASEEAVKLFAAVSGDTNPVHLDAEFAAGTMFKERIAHGMYTGGLISAAIAMEMPGPGTIYLGQELRFERPVKLGDTITITLEVIEKIDGKNFVKLKTTATNQDGKVVVSGTATVMPPKEQLTMPRLPEPKVTLEG